MKIEVNPRKYAETYQGLNGPEQVSEINVTDDRGHTLKGEVELTIDMSPAVIHLAEPTNLGDLKGNPYVKGPRRVDEVHVWANNNDVVVGLNFEDRTKEHRMSSVAHTVLPLERQNTTAEGVRFINETMDRENGPPALHAMILAAADTALREKDRDTKVYPVGTDTPYSQALRQQFNAEIRHENPEQVGDGWYGFTPKHLQNGPAVAREAAKARNREVAVKGYARSDPREKGPSDWVGTVTGDEA